MNKKKESIKHLYRPTPHPPHPQGVEKKMIYSLVLCYQAHSGNCRFVKSHAQPSMNSKHCFSLSKCRRKPVSVLADREASVGSGSSS